MSTQSRVRFVRSRVVFASAALALFLAAFVNGSAVAGGWAVSTLDPIAQSPSVGRDITIGLTIRQHGATPVALEDVTIVIVNTEGNRLSFPAVPEGAIGHYVAAVRFPVAGVWTWEVNQGWFGPQTLGSITVAEAPPLSSPADSVTPRRNRWSLPVRLALTGATLITGVSTISLRLRARRNLPLSHAPTTS